MRRLERDGLIVSRWERQSIADAEQRPLRKYYKLTRNGRTILDTASKRYPLAHQADPVSRGGERMRMRGLPHSLFVCTGILKVAAILVPGKARAEWLEEWRAELWHVWHVCNQNNGSGVAPEKGNNCVQSRCFQRRALAEEKPYLFGAPSLVQAGDAFALHPDFCGPGSRKLADCL